LNNIYKRSRYHLRSVRMSYLCHMLGAFYIIYKLISASLKLMVHAFVPSLFMTDASTTIRILAKQFEKK